eukprot:4019990-Pyramimonas_sp.AAC.1
MCTSCPSVGPRLGLRAETGADGLLQFRAVSLSRARGTTRLVSKEPSQSTVKTLRSDGRRVREWRAAP